MKFLSLVFVLMTSAMAFAGAGGHGTDNPRPDHGAAWFLQKGRPIKYCVEVGNQFGVDKAALLADISAVFKQWTDYINKRRPGSPVNSQGVFIGDCKDTKGSEDLSFYFGITNPLVTKAKKLYDDPIAMAQKTAYNTDTGWGKGFIWAINSQSSNPKEKFPNWSDSLTRYGMILHEIGHVLGSDHVEDTIMTRNLAMLFRNQQFPGASPDPNFRKIDWLEELADCYVCKYKGGPLDLNSSNINQQRAGSYFKLFTGKEAIGEVKMTYTAGFSKKTRAYQTSLEVRDASGAYSFPLVTHGNQWSMDEGYVFTYAKTVSDKYNTDGSHVDVQGSVKHVVIDNLTLITRSGQKIALIEKRNMGWRTLQVDAAIDGEIINLFTNMEPGEDYDLGFD